MLWRGRCHALSSGLRLPQSQVWQLPHAIFFNKNLLWGTKDLNLMKKSFLFTMLVASTTLFTSCATLVNGSKQTVSFTSEPSGADITLVRKGKETRVGQTPLVLDVPRKTNKVLFTKDGYYTETYNARENADIHWLYYPDLIGTFLFLIPGPIDLISGGYIRLEPNVKVELKKK